MRPRPRWQGWRKGGATKEYETGFLKSKIFQFFLKKFPVPALMPGALLCFGFKEMADTEGYVDPAQFVRHLEDEEQEEGERY